MSEVACPFAGYKAMLTCTVSALSWPPGQHLLSIWASFEWDLNIPSNFHSLFWYPFENTHYFMYMATCLLWCL